MPQSISAKSLAKKFNLSIWGDSELEISYFSSPESPKNNTIIFLSNPDDFNLTTFPKNCFLLVSHNFQHLSSKDLNLFLVEDVWKKFSEITYFFNKKEFSNFHTVPFFKGNNVSIGINCSFGTNVIIEDNVSIGDNTVICNNVVIGDSCIVGDNVFIDSGTVIGSEGFGNQRKDDGSWCHICHLGKVVIHNKVSLGSNCCIDRGTIDDTVINHGVIIDNLVHIAHNVVIGEYTAIAAKTGIAGSCKIGKRNLIGGMVGIIDHVTTADDITISATSTVTSDLTESGVYTGIMPIAKHAKWKRIALWITKLDKIAKLITKKARS